ncbi:MAG: MarR family transcriptional regulator [Candidatus Marinimicrobia bacterium]|nr:MarR family transcriptional regulator [Candidatus Neomarinimicrobiota bacterium]
MTYEQLKLENQLCFPLYAASHLITRRYQPHLEKLGITYPQYLVLMVLWEYEEMTVNSISKKLILNTNTVTPLLKRMESMDLITRQRSGKDERKVIVRLSEKGRRLREEAASIPGKLARGFIPGVITAKETAELMEKLRRIIGFLSEENK